jgi:2-keto-4-pentenoate hydratase/2-oxohepta-3-ene-1,7-dioic acid hydratase in catechol pathway
MKLLRYGPAGREKPGLLDDGGIVRDLSNHIDDINGAALAESVLSRLAALDPRTLPAVDKTERIGACVARPGKLLGIGLNYSDHAAESGLPLPKQPIIFHKATSAISGPYDPVLLPPGATKLDWEVELAFAIGTRARHVTERDALKYVAGYCICNDVSERAWQIEREGQWTKGKSYDTFAPLGPWLVTKDEISSLDSLALTLVVNADRRQNGTSATLIFKIPQIVSYLSQFMTLEPGDIITTGTPPGVGLGMKPPLYLKAGDVMRLEITGLGHQKQIVVEDTA